MYSAGAVLPMLWVSRPWFINTVAVLYCGVTEDSIRPPPDLLITWSILPRMLPREGSRRQEQFLHPLLMNHPRSITVGPNSSLVKAKLMKPNEGETLQNVTGSADAHSLVFPHDSWTPWL